MDAGVDGPSAAVKRVEMLGVRPVSPKRGASESELSAADATAEAKDQVRRHPAPTRDSEEEEEQADRDESEVYDRDARTSPKKPSDEDDRADDGIGQSILDVRV